jgi:hypothetical protein
VLQGISPIAPNCHWTNGHSRDCLPKLRPSGRCDRVMSSSPSLARAVELGIPWLRASPGRTRLCPRDTQAERSPERLRSLVGEECLRTRRRHLEWVQLRRASRASPISRSTSVWLAIRTSGRAKLVYFRNPLRLPPCKNVLNWCNLLYGLQRSVPGFCELATPSRASYWKSKRRSSVAPPVYGKAHSLWVR